MTCVHSWGSRGRGFKSRRPDGFSNSLGTKWEPDGNDHGQAARKSGQYGVQEVRQRIQADGSPVPMHPGKL